MTLPMRRTRHRRAAGRGALVVIAALLAGSALLRLGGDASLALARAAEGVVEPKETGPGPAACEPSQDLQRMLDAFAVRDQRLKEREAALRLRRKALEAAEAEIARQIDDLARAEARLRKTVAIADTAAEEDLARLTRVYESMKPARAAALFEKMDPAFAAGFLGRMRPEAAAGIMAALPADAAHGFSVVLAGRNAGAPDE